jgi:hypothetical protein
MATVRELRQLSLGDALEAHDPERRHRERDAD